MSTVVWKKWNSEKVIEKVAADTADLFDGSISAPIATTEWGLPGGTYAWTGSTWSGGSLGPFLALGADTPGLGFPYEVNEFWICANHYLPSGNDAPFYAISENLTVVPAAGALYLAVTGLLSSALGLKRLCRKHQEPNQI